MAKKEEKKTHLEEIIESPEVLAKELGKAQTFAEKNKNIILGVVAAAVIALAGYFGYTYYNSTQDEEAQNKLSSAVLKVEADSLESALKDLKKIANDYGSTNAGNMANYWAGVVSLKLGKYDDAINHLESFSSNDLLVKPRAYSLIGDAYSEKKSYDEAANYYAKAAEYQPNKFFSPGYMLKQATALEEGKKTKEAIEVYNELLEKYEDSQEATAAKKYKAKAEGAE
jgi:predicted negative regulator of RcsB-dependent stress response